MNPNAPTKKTDATNTQKHIATFSLQACFASASSLRMHASGTHIVTHRLKLYHHMARLFLAPPVTLAFLPFPPPLFFLVVDFDA